MSGFCCPMFGEQRYDGSCGLDCADCPGLSSGERVGAAQARINEGKARSDDMILFGEVIDRIMADDAGRRL